MPSICNKSMSITAPRQEIEFRILKLYDFIVESELITCYYISMLFISKDITFPSVGVEFDSASIYVRPMYTTISPFGNI